MSMNQQTKIAFHANATQILRKVAKDLGLDKSTYKISSNKGGSLVLGEVTLHHDKVYINLGEFSYWRTCEGRTDYCGGTNNEIREMSVSHIRKAIASYV